MAALEYVSVRLGSTDYGSNLVLVEIDICLFSMKTRYGTV